MLVRSTIHGRLPSAVLLILVLALPVIATAQCPNNTVTCEGTTGGWVEFYEHETSTDPTHGVSFQLSSASYNLVDGRISALAYVDYADQHRSKVVAVDRFELHHVPAAVLKIRLNLSFYWMADPGGRMAWASGLARLSVDGQSVQAESVGPGIDRTIELDVSAAEGVPFTITYESIAWAWGYYPWCELACSLEFVDPPPGAEITSCNGYNAPSVSTEETTWGEIKALYR